MHAPLSATGHAPVRFVFGVHLHQPVGNFDRVFAEHARDVYHPLVSQLRRRRFGPILMHISGSLLEWLEAHDRRLLDHIGGLVADGGIELLLAGMYEPILAAIPRADRVDQIARHREALRARFGAVGTGLWLTERVWEPELAADLADAGVEYVLVDDRHLLVSGSTREELHVPLRTENDGRAVTVLAIDERLRYLIPFRPPEEIAGYLRAARDAQLPLVVFADDGEKFGGWPGTKEWVYGGGWFDAFCDTMDALRDEGVVRMCGGREALREVPARGPVYLPTASYQEMEGWALPPEAARRLAEMERDMGKPRMAGPDRAFVRGGHWRNFLARYPESNRMHKKMVALSGLCRVRSEQAVARTAVVRAQCNDAYWHGVFGGLYLRHLRGAVWGELAHAERALREGESLGVEVGDRDCDGADEVMLHSGAFSAVVAPARGGAVVELTRFADGVNYADVLTRRLEAYHLPSLRREHAAGSGSGAASIHELEAGLGMESPPPVDLDDRAIGVARVLPVGLTLDEYAPAAYVPVMSWARVRCTMSTELFADNAVVRCDGAGLTTEWRFREDGDAEVLYRWDGSGFREGERFAVELSLAAPMEITASDALETWRFDIETVARSERGVKRAVQGISVTPLFAARRGEARIRLGAGDREAWRAAMADPGGKTR